MPTDNPTARITREELVARSAAYIKGVLKSRLPGVPVYLFGSRARGDAGRASDFDLWIDGDIAPEVLRGIEEEIAESFVPFDVNLVETRDLKGPFGANVRREAIRWT